MPIFLLTRKARQLPSARYCRQRKKPREIWIQWSRMVLRALGARLA